MWKMIFSHFIQFPNLGSSRQSRALDKFDEAFEKYKQYSNKNYKKVSKRSTIETERYFDNLAALLR